MKGPQPLRKSSTIDLKEIRILLNSTSAFGETELYKTYGTWISQFNLLNVIPTAKHRNPHGCLQTILSASSKLFL